MRSNSPFVIPFVLAIYSALNIKTEFLLVTTKADPQIAQITQICACYLCNLRNLRIKKSSKAW
jgi:hypothetical protein